jgi:hypothetical protein
MRGSEQPPLVSLVGEQAAAELLDYPRLEVARGEPRGELVAVLGAGSRPAGNWLTAAVPFFADAGVSAVVVPMVASLEGTLGRRVAAAVLESRLGGGSRRSLYFPGNVRLVSDHPAADVVMRRADYLSASSEGVDDEQLVSWLAERGKQTIYTPDTSVSSSPPALVRPHLAATIRHARARGAAARRTRGGSLSGASALSLAPAAAAVLGATFLLVGGSLRDVGLGLLLAYAIALAVSGVHAAARFHSPLLGLLQPPAVVVSQGAYLVGFLRGLIEPGAAATRAGPRAAPPSRTG